MFLENKMVDDRISRAIDNDHTAAMKAPGDNKKHMRKKGPSGDMITVCMTCKKAFKNPLFYRKHMRLHAEKTIACHLCGKTFERKHYLQAHLQSHGKLHFQCSVCHKRFSQKGQLNQHLKFHCGSPGGGKYKCNACEKDFFQQEHLRAHLRNHGDERPFECEICKKRFNIKSSLQRHMSCHTGEKPFLCAICNRGYTRRSVLVLHIQQVHENRKPFQCEECQLCFSQKGNLQAHFRRKHLQPKSSEGGGGKRAKEGKSKRAHKRQRPNPSRAIKICANKNYVPSEEARPTSLHSYASKAKVAPGPRKDASEDEDRGGGSFYASLESSSSCSTSDEAAAGSSSSGDDVAPAGFSPHPEGFAQEGPYDIKSLTEFESLLEWEDNFITDSDNMLCSLLPNYDLNDALTSPSKSNIVLTRAAGDAPEDAFSASAWSDYPLFTAEDLDEIKDIGGANYFAQRISQNSKTVNPSNFAIQKLNFSSLQA